MKFASLYDLVVLLVCEITFFFFFPQSLKDLQP